jgi:hypothetical protein
VLCGSVWFVTWGVFAVLMGRLGSFGSAWPSGAAGWPWGRRRGWIAWPVSVSRRAGGVGARRERARRRGRHRRLTIHRPSPHSQHAPAWRSPPGVAAAA